MTPELLRPPAADAAAGTEIGRFVAWLARHRGLAFDDYAALHAWSVADLPGFWSAVREFFDVRCHTPATAVLGGRGMPGAAWFPGATLNYAEHALRAHGADGGR